MKYIRSHGFTLLEILISLSIMLLLVFVVSGVFRSFNKKQEIESKVVLAKSLLEEARARTLSSRNDKVYGVHFETAHIVLFEGGTYSAGVATNELHDLGPHVSLFGTALSDGGSDIIFKRLTGETLQNGTVTLSLVSDVSQKGILTISTTGLVQVN